MHIFSAEEIEKLAETTIEKMWGWFKWIGSWTSGILGIYFIIRFAKIVIEVIINAIAIQKEHGWSIKILASFWDTLTMWLLHRKHKKEVFRNMRKITERSDTPSDNNPPNPGYFPTAPDLAYMYSENFDVKPEEPSCSKVSEKPLADTRPDAKSEKKKLTKSHTITYVDLKQAIDDLKEPRNHTWF